MDYGNHVQSGRYVLRTKDKSGKSGGAAVEMGIVKKEEISTSGGNKVKRCRKRKAEKPSEPRQGASRTVRKREVGDDTDINLGRTRKRRKTPEVLPPTPTSEKRKAIIRQRSRTSTSVTHGYNTRANPNPKGNTLPPTPDSVIESIQTHTVSNDVPKPMEDISVELVDNQHSTTPNLPTASTFLDLGFTNENGKDVSTKQPALEPPFEYIPTPGTRESHEKTSEEAEIRLPEPLTLEPEFARLLDYTLPENSGTSSLDVLAGVASRTSNETFSGFSETSTQDPKLIAEEVEQNTPIQGVTENLRASSVNNMDDLDMQEIIPGLFLGSCRVFHPSNIETFRNLGIRNIFTCRKRWEVTLIPWDMEASQIMDSDESLNREWVELSDHPFEILLTPERLPRIMKKINSLLSANERVYVHCQMGISRSVAIIIAYLMSYRNLSFEDARLLVRNYRQNINPNHGFVQQLHVWNAIKDDWENRESSPEYRHWRTAFRAKVVTNNRDRNAGRIIVFGNRSPLPKVLADVVEIFPKPATLEDDLDNVLSSFPLIQRPKDSYYRCCRCRYPLAPAHAAFSLTPEHNIFTDLPACTHIFLACRLSWMNEQIDTSSPGGKLYCPGCSDVTLGLYYVGEYCWMGVQCENEACGEIVSPGLALIRRLEGDTPTGVEFRQVEEDGDEFISSQETCDESNDDDEEQQPDSAQTGSLAAEDEGSWADIETAYNEACDAEDTPQPTSAPTDGQPMEVLSSCQIHPKGRKVNSPPRPPKRNSLNSPEHLRYIPTTPSRLRNTWIPRSMPSTPGNSQGSQESQESVNFLTSEPSSISTSDEQEEPSQVLQWLAGIQRTPPNSPEALGAIDEYLSSEDMCIETL